MRKATFITAVYNGEKFVEETIQSVLNQTEPDFWFVIRLNACVDRSEEIVRAYAEKDNRIIVLKNKVNYMTDDGVHISKRGFWPEFDSEYVVKLDHDDILHPDFLKILYEAGHTAHADLVVGGCYFFDDVTKKITNERIPPQLQTNCISDLKGDFPALYGSLRTLWGKLYSAKLFDQCYEEMYTRPEKLKLCGDTWAVFVFLEHCTSFVSVAQPLMYYRTGQSSQFFSKIPEVSRIYEGKILFDRGMECLQNIGCDTAENIRHLYSVYAGHMADLIFIVQNSNSMTAAQKLEYLQLILQDTHLASYRNSAVVLLQPYIQECVKKIYASDKDNPALFRYYLYRLEHVYQKQDHTKEGLLIYLSVMADRANPLLYGIELLSHMYWNQTPKKEAVWLRTPLEQKLALVKDQPFVQAIQQIYPPNTVENELEQQMLAAMEEDEWVRAFELLQKLEDITMLHESGIFCRLMLLLIQDKIQEAIQFAYVAKSIFPESMAIQNICDQL